jgi:glycosyltransferase involved in cell wall biosynthesis
MPTVSIIMSVYNGKELLPMTMRSMLEQTFRDFEFIIIDDGSTDGVTDLLRDYAKHDSRIKLVVRENKGLTKTLNEGLHLATAPLIARMDADDIAMPDRLAKQVAFMNAHPEVVLLGGAHDYIDAEGRKLITMRPPTDNASLQQQCLDGTTPICHPLAMFRRDAAIKVGGYDESYLVAQDLDLWLRLGEVGELACLPDVILQYRLHDKSVSEKKQVMQVANMKRACETAWQRRGITGTFKGEKGWRAEGDSQSVLRQTLKFGWWAWKSGQNKTARFYGVRAIRLSPFSSDGYKLLVASFKSPQGGAA